jgi:serine/threonine protein kinase
MPHCLAMQDPRWRALTESAKDLILKLLQPDPKNRYTAKQALNHRWIKGAREDSILDGSVMEGWADHVQLMQHAYMGTPSPCARSPPLATTMVGGGSSSNPRGLGVLFMWQQIAFVDLSPCHQLRCSSPRLLPVCSWRGRCACRTYQVLQLLYNQAVLPRLRPCVHGQRSWLPVMCLL